jgi:CheY-like chemotaxis protein
VDHRIFLVCALACRDSLAQEGFAERDRNAARGSTDFLEPLLLADFQLPESGPVGAFLQTRSRQLRKREICDGSEWQHKEKVCCCRSSECKEIAKFLSCALRCLTGRCDLCVEARLSPCTMRFIANALLGVDTSIPVQWHAAFTRCRDPQSQIDVCLGFEPDLGRPDGRQSSRFQCVNSMEKILIVEDDLAVRKALTRLFESVGYAVETSEDGKSALELFHLASPTAVILDLAVPVVSGKDVCLEIKKHMCTLPVIIVTGRTDVVDKVLLLELVCDHALQSERVVGACSSSNP